MKLVEVEDKLYIIGQKIKAVSDAIKSELKLVIDMIRTEIGVN